MIRSRNWDMNTSPFSFAGPVAPSIWPENALGISSSLLIDSDAETCIDFPPDDLRLPFVVKVPTEKFKGVKRLAVIHGNLRDTMDPCNGMPFLVMTQSGAENTSDTICRPYCGRPVRCSFYNEDKQANELGEYNKTTSVEVECHCWSADGCNGVFLQISLTSLVNQKVPGKLCEIDLSPERTPIWVMCSGYQGTLSPILRWIYWYITQVYSSNLINDMEWETMLMLHYSWFIRIVLINC